ncbi:nacht ankyrin containing protein [Fusarium denticulatum]|uniref:Nacht ankyrin containing protein n=1 Tax=Fusarium denticulatum TaxID=48507 RepID=A0A8H5WYI2_9HYPO|nr:nacht ankyrin containing protein [Fusarium denticulatum]
MLTARPADCIHTLVPIVQQFGSGQACFLGASLGQAANPVPPTFASDMDALEAPETAYLRAATDSTHLAIILRCDKSRIEWPDLSLVPPNPSKASRPALLPIMQVWIAIIKPTQACQLSRPVDTSVFAKLSVPSKMPDAERFALDKNKLDDFIEFLQAPIDAPAEDCNRMAKTLHGPSSHELFSLVFLPPSANIVSATTDHASPPSYRVYRYQLGPALTRGWLSSLLPIAASENIPTSFDRCVNIETAVSNSTQMRHNPSPGQNSQKSTFGAYGSSTQNNNTGPGVQVSHSVISGGVNISHQLPSFSPQESCSQTLAFQEMNQRGHGVETATHATCEWLFKNSTYRSWQTSNRGLLWIRGHPGSGKSTLLKHVLGAIEKNNDDRKDVILSFFFHGRGVELQKKPIGLFRSLLFQLLHSAPETLQNLIATCETNISTRGSYGDKWSWDENELLVHLESSVNQLLEERSIWLFIDALDESGHENARKLVAKLEKLTGAPETSFKFRTCFTCRNYPRLALRYGCEIIIDKEVEQDISTYVKEKFLTQKAQIPPNIMETITHRAKGIFLWARLVSERVINRMMDNWKWDSIEAEIDLIPDELDQLYEQLLDRMEDASLRLVRWLCYSIRPLSPQALQCAIKFDEVVVEELQSPQPRVLHDRIDMGNYTGDIKFETEVLGLTRGLAEVVFSTYGQPTVQFIHESVRDFFMRKDLLNRLTTLHARGAEMAEWTRANEVGRTHYWMSRVCLHYLAIQNSDEVSLGDTKSVVEIMLADPFLVYATLSWIDHARESERLTVAQHDLLHYFRWPSEDLVQRWTLLYRNHPLLSSYSTKRFKYMPYGNFMSELDDGPPVGIKMIHLLSRYNLIQPLRTLLRSSDQGSNYVNSKTSRGRTALSFAAESGHTSIVALLLEQQAQGTWPIFVVELRDLISDLINLPIIKHFIAVLKRGNKLWTWILLRTGTKELVSAIRKAFNVANLDPNARDDCGRTPIFFAAENGHKAVVKLLLATGKVGIYATDVYGRSPLHRAVERGHKSIVKLFIKNDNFNVNRQDRYGRTPLFVAAENGHDTLVSSNPTIAALVWGSVKMTIMIILNAVPYYEAFVELCMELGRICPRFEQYQALFPASERLQNTLCTFNATIIQCCRRVLAMPKRSSGWTSPLNPAFWQSLQQVLESDLQKLRDHIKNVNKEIRFAVDQSQHRNNELQRLENAQAGRSRRSLSRFMSRTRDDFGRAHQKQYPKSAEWIFGTDEFKRWVNGPTPSLLWCSGKMGSGKSIISPESHVTFFFSRFDDSESMRAETILRALVRQLITIQEVPGPTKQVLETLQIASDDISSKLSQLLTRLLSRKGPTSWVILDSINECQREERQILIKVLRSMLDDGVNARLFMTSRDYLDSVFKGDNVNLEQISMNCSLAQYGMAQLVDQAVQKCIDVEELLVSDQTLIAEIKNTLTKHADGMILWVTLILRHLCSQPNNESVREAITLKRKDSIVQALILWIVAAKQPLTLSQLKECCLIKPLQEYTIRDRYVNRIHHIENWFQGLVEIDYETKTVHFIRACVQQSFLAAPDNPALSNFHVRIRDADRHIGEICVTHSALLHVIATSTERIEQYHTVLFDYVLEHIDANLLQRMLNTETCRSTFNLLCWKAATYGRLDIIEALFEGGVDINAYGSLSDILNRLPLIEAAENGHIEVMEYLPQKGANPNSQTHLYRSALEPAAKLGGLKGLQACRLLIDAGANARDTDALLSPCAHGDRDIIKLLLTADDDVNASYPARQWKLPTNDGPFVYQDNTPLLEAFSIPKPEVDIIELLIGAGAKINILVCRTDVVEISPTRAEAKFRIQGQAQAWPDLKSRIRQMAAESEKDFDG